MQVGDTCGRHRGRAGRPDQRHPAEGHQPLRRCRRQWRPLARVSTAGCQAGSGSTPGAAEAGVDTFLGEEKVLGAGLGAFGLCFHSFIKIVLALDIRRCSKFSVALYHIG